MGLVSSIGRQHIASVVAAAALIVTSCASGTAEEPECDAVVDDLILATQAFLDVLGDKAWEEAPFISSVDIWISEYADIHLERARLFVSLSDVLSQANLDALAAEVEQMDGVQSVKVSNQEEALAEMRLLFADQPEILERIEDDPDSVPPNIQVAVAPDKSTEVSSVLEARSEVVGIIDDPWSIDDLVHGVELLNLPEPALDQPMAQAASLGCTEDVLLTRMRERSEELHAPGTAGEFFIRSIVDDQ